jgi:dipeptidyl aminopeptidase/acylaminoacyl peptidase
MKISGLAIVFIAVSMILSLTNSCKEKEQVNSTISLNSIPYIGEQPEVDNRFLITQDKSIIFSGNDSSRFELFRYFDGKIEKLSESNRNLFKPFIFNGTVSALVDKDGDEDFKTTNASLNKIINGYSMESIFTFQNGKLLIYKLKGDPSAYYYNLTEQRRISIGKVQTKIHGAGYCSTSNILILSFDNLLVSIDVLSGSTQALIKNIPGEKLNPFIYDNQVFFASNFESEYSQLYKLIINNSNSSPILVLKSSHDLRMPKYISNSLYYIELIKSEYLLKRKDSLGKESFVTTKGVIYDYEFYDEDKIVMTYSDFFTATSIQLFDIKSNSVINLSSKPITHDITYRYIQEPSLSPAFELIPPKNVTKRGNILFFHPSLHGDYSPRWDPILMNLCNSGYKIIIPNYPMSIGFGKKYYQSSLSEAVEDLRRWTLKLKRENISLYFLSSSSGNILMERLLFHDNGTVVGAGTFFGTYENGIMTKTVPVLYALGKNDPIVNVDERREYLQTNLKNSKSSLIIFDDEGHWLRKTKNRKTLVKLIRSHFMEASN